MYRQIPQPRCLHSSRGSRAAPGHFGEVSSLMSHSPQSGTGHEEGRESTDERFSDSNDQRTDDEKESNTSRVEKKVNNKREKVKSRIKKWKQTNLPNPQSNLQNHQTLFLCVELVSFEKEINENVQVCICEHVQCICTFPLLN